MRQLKLPMHDIEEQFRRMVFNVVARNQDDHVKNIAYLMDKSGRWALAPAYDITYSYNPNGAWTSRHQMTINTKRDQFSREDFRAVAKATSMKRGRDTAIIEEVRAAVMRWREFADAAGVDATWAEEIGRNLRLDL
jgi:serine/threonine-protein kinase HipA